jgi:diguanylate cyclase (GGDEF)-like protein
VALALSLGAPLGLLAVRIVERGGAWGLGFVRSQIADDLGTFAYVGLSTSVVFVVFAHVVGRQADRLYEVSGTDVLTGLRNRGRIEERLEEEMLRARRYGTGLAVLLIDLDGLKSWNDRFGHRAGDRALQSVAAAIRKGSRAADLAARWGGDEFLLLAPNTSVEEARTLGERIRALVAAQGDPSAPQTVSVGIGSHSPGAGPGSMEGLVAAADAALYEAKRLGRNRVVVTPGEG